MQSMPLQPPIFFKNPTIATVLSFLITGLGQLYNGQILKGTDFSVVLFRSDCMLVSEKNRMKEHKNQ